MESLLEDLHFNQYG